MALVPMKIIEKWYVEDHFLYKNFRYIWKNPLWDKEHKMPRGFSVCPFFWMSLLVGFLGLRLMLVPTMMLVKKLFIDPLANTFKTVDGKCSDQLGIIHGGLGLGIAMAILAIGGLVGIYACCHFMFLFYMASIAAFPYEPSALIALISMTMFVPTFIVCDIYATKHRYDPDRCKVEYYTMVVGAAGLIASLASGGARILLPIVLTKLSLIFSIGNGILSWIYGIMVGIMFGFFCVPIFMGLSIGALCAIVIAVNYLLYKLMLDASYEQPKPKEHPTEADWYDVLALGLSVDGVFKEVIKNELGSHHDTKVFKHGLYHVAKEFIRDSIAIHEELLEMPWVEFLVHRREILGYAKKYESLDSRLNWHPSIREIIRRINMMSFAPAAEIFDRMYGKRFYEECAWRGEQMRLEQERRERMRQRCKAVTGALEKFFAPVIRTAKVTRAVVIGVAAYSMIILKAKKEKACPYLMFQKKEKACPYLMFQKKEG